MTDPITTVGTAATAAALAKLLDTEIIKHLLAPVTQQAGLIAGDLAGIVRTYTTFNLAQVLTRWAQQRNNKPLEAAEFIRVIPLLQAASQVSDNDLQECWAALLESSVTHPNTTLPSFGLTLSQMTAEEARFLCDIYNQSAKTEIGDMSRLIAIYQEFTLKLDYFDKEKMSSAEQQAFLLVNDILRLGLIDWRQEPHRRFRDEGRVDYLDDVFSRSEYGVRFLEAVTPRFPEQP